MEQIKKNIEDWIKPYATIVGDKIDVDIDLKKENPTKYFLRLTQPNHFESYAIALHSFWINFKVPNNEIKENQNNDIELPEDEFTRVNWKDFYELKNVPFELNSAILNSVNWKSPFKQMNNELFPGEGLMDEEHLESLVKTVMEIYGNQEVELFYTFLSTQNLEEDLIFRGKINDLPTLIKKQDLRLTPSLIYPKERNWFVNTDYDLAFSTIGGGNEFINKLTAQNSDEIFKIEY